MRALIITGKYVQDHEFIYPFYRLQEAGFIVEVAIRGNIEVPGILGTPVKPTRDIEGIKVEDYDLLVLPGGAKAMEKIRQDKEVIEFIRKFDEAKKPIASICHAAQLLITARVVKGRKISAYYSIEDDVNNAGAEYYDGAVVVDGNIISSPHYKYMGDWMKETLKFFDK